MLIGLGGGAASSQTSAEGSVDLDFASVQRGNAEVQRRAQEVINACVAMGSDNPILFIHDIGAGGLSNGIPELVHDSDLGAKIELREVDNADRGLSPLEIWYLSKAQHPKSLPLLTTTQQVLRSSREICDSNFSGEYQRVQGNCPP